MKTEHLQDFVEEIVSVIDENSNVGTDVEERNEEARQAVQKLLAPLEEQLTQLARVVVRQGERINAAIEQWQEESAEIQKSHMKFGEVFEVRDVPIATLAGRIEAAMALSNGLIDDLETGMSVNDCYVLARQEMPGDAPDEATELARLRRKLRIARAELELQRNRADQLEGNIQNAGKEPPHPGSD